MSKTAIAKRENVSIAVPVQDDFLNMIMQAAANPDVDVTKLQALLDMKERVLDKAAKSEWQQAMSEVQEEMRRVKANKANPQTRSKYADYAALDRVLRPIYTRHGFSLTFDTGQGEDPAPVPQDCIRVWLSVRHQVGHVERFHVDMPADGKGAKGGDIMTKTHATGAGMQYGMRYLLKFAFNVAVGEDDDDGNSASYQPPQQDEPVEQNNPVRAPQSKSASKTTRPGVVTNPLGLKRAPSVDDKISPSNIKTLQSQMTHHKIAPGRFREVMGFPLEDASRHDLNAIVSWIKGEAR